MTGRKSILARRIGIPLAAILILVSTFMGYGAFSTGAMVRNCYAQIPIIQPVASVTGSSCAAACGTAGATPMPCIGMGTVGIATRGVSTAFKAALGVMKETVKTFLSMGVDGIVGAARSNIRGMEENLISWWETMATYNLTPGMKAAARQANLDAAQKTVMLAKTADAAAATDARIQEARTQVDGRRTTDIDDNGCAVATVSGGLGRATAFGKAMRGGLQNRGSWAGSNKRGMRGASGLAALNKAKSDTYESMFCDPADNAGGNVCGTTAKPEFYNADTKATEILYNKLTIPVTDPNYQAATEAIIENMVGNPGAEVIDPGALLNNGGQETFLARRSFSARYNAVGSVPRIIAGPRMPGAGPDMAQWVAQLRRGDGVTPLVNDKDLSANPSYREIMHALTAARFNSSTYANSLIASKTAREMEKLTLNTFQLMMLRDYYELMERAALTLAVQVSMMADQQPVVDASRATPARKSGGAP